MRDQGIWRVWKLLTWSSTRGAHNYPQPQKGPCDWFTWLFALSLHKIFAESPDFGAQNTPSFHLLREVPFWNQPLRYAPCETQQAWNISRACHLTEVQAPGIEPKTSGICNACNHLLIDWGVWVVRALRSWEGSKKISCGWWRGRVKLQWRIWRVGV